MTPQPLVPQDVSASPHPPYCARPNFPAHPPHHASARSLPDRRIHPRPLSPFRVPHHPHHP
eukprot:5040985-Pleurochrysis_carterae.AAC.1